MISKSLLFITVVTELFLVLLATADKYTAPVDYGFGPLTITVDSEGDILARCEEVDITLGGGFGPYKLVSVNAKNRSIPIKLKTNETAVWEAAVSEGSHVAFNVTDRAGATHQTPLFKVRAGEDGVTCGNSTLFMNEPVKEETSSKSGSNRSRDLVQSLSVPLAVFTIILAPAIIIIVM